MKQKKMRWCLLLALLLILSSCSRIEPEQESEETGTVTESDEMTAPEELETSEEQELRACTYSVTGGAADGHTCLSLEKDGETVLLSFTYAESSESEETELTTEVEPSLLSGLEAYLYGLDMRSWVDFPPADTIAADESVTSVRLQYADGLQVYFSTLDQLPDDGTAVMSEIANRMLKAVTTDGRQVFGGKEALVNLDSLSEQESTADITRDEYEFDSNSEALLSELRDRMDAEGALAAVALLGYPDNSGGAVGDDRGYLSLLLDEEGYNDWEFLADLPSDCFTQTEEGNTLFVLITCSPDAEVQVLRQENSKGTSEETVLYAEDGRLPLLLCCNAEPESPDTTITVTDSEGSGSFSLSVDENGRITACDGIMDFSSYLYAVG